jgi:hypothetical protein
MEHTQVLSGAFSTGELPASQGQTISLAVLQLEATAVLLQEGRFPRVRRGPEAEQSQTTYQG